jgi:hypothetical protein
MKILNILNLIDWAFWRGLFVVVCIAVLTGTKIPLPNFSGDGSDGERQQQSTQQSNAAQKATANGSLYQGQKTLTISWYDPALVKLDPVKWATNCMHPCDTTATGEYVPNWYNKGAACPRSWTSAGAKIYVPLFGWVECIDTGGKIVESSNSMWIDMLWHYQDEWNGAYPYNYGDTIPAGQWGYTYGELDWLTVSTAPQMLAPDVPSGPLTINTAVRLLYNGSDPWMTAGLHQGAYDYKAGCDTTLYSPVPGEATVIWKGYDGYIGPYSYNTHYVPSSGIKSEDVYGNSQIDIEGPGGYVRILHGHWDVEIGDVVVGGVDKIGTEGDVGNSTGCHSHIQVVR